MQVRHVRDDEALLRGTEVSVERTVRDLIVILAPGEARAHAQRAALVPRLRAFWLSAPPSGTYG